MGKKGSVINTPLTPSCCRFAAEKKGGGRGREEKGEEALTPGAYCPVA